MSAISASSTSISDLMQTFSSVATPALSSLLSSSQVQSALAKSSPADIVQLSDQAMQLQEVDGLFGSSPSTEASNPGMAMQNLLTSIYTGSTGSAINLLA
jgi:hypothetical protein